jgi:hypothetical protein
MSVITPDDVKKLTKPTDGFLCPLSANSYGLDFLAFSISDYESKKIIFEVSRDSPSPKDMSLDFSTLGEDMYRKIKYEFSEDVLKLPAIQTNLTFSVGNREIRGFRMIERHYFRNELVKSFDFSFGFCIPGSTNSWEAVYSLPPLSDELINDMINHPHETKSDSFYFVDNKLVMHNKASYKYFREDAAQTKKSYEDKFGSKADKTVEKQTSSAGAKPGAKEGAKVSATGLETAVEAMDIADGKPVNRVSPTGSKLSKQEWSKESDYN